MSHPLRFALAVGALLASLAACKPQKVVVEPEDDQKTAVANAAPVELPPSIQASKSYRCKDNSVVYIDWFSGDKQATLRATKGGSPTLLKSEEAGAEKTAEGGYALSGGASAATIDLAQPGKGKQNCKA